MDFAEGVPCWVDATLPDVEGGKRFYGELFGWTFEDSSPAECEPDGGSGQGGGSRPGGWSGQSGWNGPGGRSGPGVQYTRAFLGGEPVAGLAPKSDGRMPTSWTVYLATPDAAALAVRVKGAGGQMITDPVPVGPYGTVGLAADPEGAVFGLWQAGTHPGFGRQREPGSFCWTEVYARSTEVDLFYEGVFGYGSLDLEDELGDGGEDFRIWSPAGTEAGPGTAFGGRAVMADGFPPEMPPHFLNYFVVADCDAAIATARRLGGRVRDEPVDTPYGRIGALVDNQGAAFAVLQEPDRRSG
ncbi:VOC family protein [Streptomyces silvensis]|uniref:Hydrolase n=1 Tax=Streptomyces silvensis TaxID=1765722 RepID=A0A0W7X9M3_9ACTN|nr:VOC family protein [Streptomyces silvensis]KUF19673.1 hydrolase [Streptomyces silvensis]